MLFDLLSEPLAADGVAVAQGYVAAYQQACVQHRLYGEALHRADICAPVHQYVVHAYLPLHAYKVVCAVAVSGMHTRAVRGEVPLVLGVEVCRSAVGEVVTVLGADGIGAECQHVAVVVEVVPSHACLNYEVAELEVHRGEVALVLTVAEVVGASAKRVNVDVVVSQGVGQSGAEHAPRECREFYAAGDASAEAQRALQGHRYAGLDRQFAGELDGAHLFAVEAESSADNGVCGACVGTLRPFRWRCCRRVVVGAERRHGVRE